MWYISKSTCDTKTILLLTKLTSQKLKKSHATNSFLSFVGAVPFTNKKYSNDAEERVFINGETNKSEKLKTARNFLCTVLSLTLLKIEDSKFQMIKSVKN